MCMIIHAFESKGYWRVGAGVSGSGLMENPGSSVGSPTSIAEGCSVEVPPTRGTLGCAVVAVAAAGCGEGD